MKKTVFQVLLLLTMPFCLLDCVGQESNLEAEAYRSYTAQRPGSSFQFINRSGKYDYLAQDLFIRLGFPAIDIQIKIVRENGAFAVISKDCKKRYILYRESFLDDVVNKTGDEDGVKCIFLHEIGHHFNGHPLNANSKPRRQERFADRYAGFQAFRLNLDKESALGAIKEFATSFATTTHPNRESRINEFNKGYYEAGGAPPTPEKPLKEFLYQQENIEALSQLMETERFGLKSFEKIDTLNFDEALSRVSGEDNVVYNLLGNIVLLDPNGVLRFADEQEPKGKLIRPFEEADYFIFQIDYSKYILDNEQIYAINPDGSRMRVGFKLN